MSLLASIRRLWRSALPRKASDVEEEFCSTLDAYQEDLVRQDLSEEEARRKVRIELGPPAGQNETYRNAMGLRFFDEPGGDIRYGLRGLRRNPGFSAVAILLLALGRRCNLMYGVLHAPPRRIHGHKGDHEGDQDQAGDSERDPCVSSSSRWNPQRAPATKCTAVNAKPRVHSAAVSLKRIRRE
jgi:hypothetical protein